MKRTPAFAPATLVLTTLLWPGAALAQQTPLDPDRWEKDIAAFEAADQASPQPRGEIVFVGSSTIRRWDLPTYFPDLQTINRGFGGSEMADATRYVDRIVIPYSPRLVVVYSGDNDIGTTTSEQIAISFERFTRAVHAKLPQTRIVIIGIKPSPLRWAQIDRMRMANTMIRAFCERDDRIAYVDVDQALLGWDERPRLELYVEDRLHLSPQGYQIFTALLRPFLMSPQPTHTAERTTSVEAITTQRER